MQNKISYLCVFVDVYGCVSVLCISPPLTLIKRVSKYISYCIIVLVISIFPSAFAPSLPRSLSLSLFLYLSFNLLRMLCRRSFKSTSNSEQLNDHRLNETHVFRAAYRQSIQTEVSNHVRDSVKWTTELTEDVLTGIVPLDSHVHESLGASEMIQQAQQKSIP